MTGNEIVEYIIESIPKSVEIWIDNNYKLIALILLIITIISFNILLVKTLLDKLNKHN